MKFSITSENWKQLANDKEAIGNESKKKKKTWKKNLLQRKVKVKSSRRKQILPEAKQKSLFSL